MISGEENLREAHSDNRHLSRSTPHAGCGDNGSPQGITIQGAKSAILEGILLLDHPNHHIIAGANGKCVDGSCVCNPEAARGGTDMTIATWGRQWIYVDVVGGFFLQREVQET